MDEKILEKYKNRYGLYYNHDSIGDVLIIEFLYNVYPKKVIKKEDAVFLYDNEDNLVGINIFNISKIIKIKANGFIYHLNKEVYEVLRSYLSNLGFNDLVFLESSGFKIARIIEIEEHPESEHLHICKVDVGEDDYFQVVCGAYNAKEGMKCVMALPYTFMSDGKQIIPNKLLKVDSYGMLCSGRELGLPGYEKIHGLLEIDDDSLKVGDDFYSVYSK